MASTVRGVVKLVGKNSLRRILEGSATRADGRACVWIPFWLTAARTEHGRGDQRGRLAYGTIRRTPPGPTGKRGTDRARLRSSRRRAPLGHVSHVYIPSCAPCLLFPSPISVHSNMAPTDAHHQFTSKGSDATKRRLSHSGKKPHQDGYVSLTVRDSLPPFLLFAA